jgi:hypothetical protein
MLHTKPSALFIRSGVAERPKTRSASANAPGRRAASPSGDASRQGMRRACVPGGGGPFVKIGEGAAMYTAPFMMSQTRSSAMLEFYGLRLIGHWSSHDFAVFLQRRTRRTLPPGPTLAMTPIFGRSRFNSPSLIAAHWAPVSARTLRPQSRLRARLSNDRWHLSGAFETCIQLS